MNQTHVHMMLELSGSWKVLCWNVPIETLASEVFPTSFRSFQLQIVRKKNFQVYLQSEMVLMEFFIAPDWTVCD